MDDAETDMTDEAGCRVRRHVASKATCHFAPQGIPHTVPCPKQ
jgi:hypothetical protein